MLGTNNLIAFVATTNGPHLRAFYEQTLGLAVQSEDDYALVLNANGVMLRLQKLAHVELRSFTVLGWEVDDIQSTVAALASKGVAFERYEGMGQDPQGVWTSPSGARIAWFKDPDGNTLSLTQF